MWTWKILEHHHWKITLKGWLCLVGPRQIYIHSVSYEPSFLPTDFSGFLPFPSVDRDVALSSSCNVDAVVSSAWNSLRAEEYKMPWETDVWNQFLGPGVTVMEQMSRGFKRPFSTPAVSVAEGSDSTEIDVLSSQRSYAVCFLISVYLGYCLASGGPPTSFGSPKKNVVGAMFHVVR